MTATIIKPGDTSVEWVRFSKKRRPAHNTKR
ncbi:DUF1187 family protein [Enterobacter hormaechei]|nr:DUF1187 family protein [Enterobacter hormaechei]